jgi:TonB family protein
MAKKHTGQNKASRKPGGAPSGGDPSGAGASSHGGDNGTHDARTMHASRVDLDIPAPRGRPPGPAPSAPPAGTGPDAQTSRGSSSSNASSATKARTKPSSTGAKKPPLPRNKATKKAQESIKLGVDVAVLWRGDMLTASFFPNPTTVTAGPEGAFVVPEEAIGGKCQTLVEPHTAAKFGLRIDLKKATGHIIVDGNVHDVADVRDGKVDGLRGPVVPLTGGVRAVLVFDDFTFIISRVPVPPPAKFAFFDRRIIPFAVSWVAAFLLTTIPLMLAFNSPEWRNRAQMTFLQLQEQRLSELEFIEVQEEEKEEEQQEEEPEEEKKKEEVPIKKEMEKVEEKEEKEVVKEVNEIEKALEQLNEDEKDKKVKEMVDTAVKQTAELDEALSQIDQQALGTRLFAESDDGSGDSTANPEAGAGGSEVIADPTGETAGLAAVAGKTEDRLGGKSATERGKIASLEKNKDAGKDVKLHLKARAQKVVRVGGARGSKASGELPKKVIKRYIARKMGAIKACYQKGLQGNPGLQGKVRVKFLIMPTGQVAGAKIQDSGLNSPMVENCIVKNIKTWKFPRAKGGGSTRVIYPFVFSRR